MRFLLAIATVAATLTAGAQGTTEAILDYANPLAGEFTSLTAGWSFQPSTYITVTQLGCFANFFDSNHNQLAAQVQVGLWTGDTLLSSVFITPTNTLVNKSLYAPVVDQVLLSPNTTYEVGVYYPGSFSLDAVPGPPDGFITNSVDILQIAAVQGSGGFAPPSLQNPIPGAAYLGPNFQYQRGVPEPFPGLLVGLGGLFLAARWRYRRS